MLIRFASLGRAWALCSLTAILLALALPLAAQQAPETPAAALERIKLSLDRVEAILKADQLSAEALGDLRRTIVSAREDLQAQIEALGPRAAEIDARLRQLGPAPARDAPPEDATIAADRERLTQDFRQVDGLLKQARLLAVRTEQLNDGISERRRGLYTRRLFERGASVLDPSFWAEAAVALPGELRSLAALLRQWAESAAEAGMARIAPAALLLLLILSAGIALTRWWLRRFSEPRADTRFARARAALWVFVSVAARTPIAVIAAVIVLEAFGLLGDRVTDIANGLAAGVVVASFGRGVALGLLAPQNAARRLIAIDDHIAGCLSDHLTWGTRVLGAAIFLQVAHKTLFTAIAVTVATNALFAFAIVVLLLHLARCLRRAEAQGEDPSAGTIPGVRLIAWLVVVCILGGLIAGYVTFAAFLALRTVVAATLLGALYLCLQATEGLFSEALAPDTARSRAIALNLGIAPRNVGVVGALLSAVIRVVLIVLALVLIVSPWEISTADLADSAQSIPLSFKVGEITISFRAILAAALVLLVGLFVTRVAQRWLQRDFLPRTAIESSLQVSIGAIFGYVGAIIAISLALSSLGIDLQKIAFIAGALSVGIGFGLQSIVSNFVSGLILLAERPIRVGDWIVVGSDEGWVRRVRVRATEIETFDRASVIIPNSALITGTVKNWTHANAMGRIKLKVGVSYASDAEQVRDILMDIAKGHPQVLADPPPFVSFAAFGDSALEFELGCVVSNVFGGGAVRNDLNFEILKRFRAAGIEIPFPQRDINLRSGPPPALAQDGAPATS